MSEEGIDSGPPAEAESAVQTPLADGPLPQYWLRVHGYPSDLSSEVVYYSDFCDLLRGPLPGDPAENLKVGDVLIYYADGPGSLYGTATIVGPVEGPFEHARRGRIWRVPVKRDSYIRVINKAPHAVALQPPSGRHFISLVRDYTYIRLPEQDGGYLVSQVKARAGTRE